MTYAAYLKQRLDFYDGLIAKWKPWPSLREDVLDLEKHRSAIHERYMTAAGKERRAKTHRKHDGRRTA